MRKDISSKLKDCYPGTILFDVSLDSSVLFLGFKVENGHLYVRCLYKKFSGGEKIILYTRYGESLLTGKVTLFPSKDDRDWDYFGKPKFKDGDILTVMSDNGPLVYIKRGDEREDGHIHFHVIRNIAPIRHCASNEEKKKNIESVDMDSIRYALDEERISFLLCLSKNGWKWDDEICRVEFTGAPPRCYLRAFDPVLVRTGNEAIWRPSFFGYKEKAVMLKNPYVCTNGSRWAQCIPYNENEELIGTPDVPRIG